jgi:hypothetical protein
MSFMMRIGKEGKGKGVHYSNRFVPGPDYRQAVVRRRPDRNGRKASFSTTRGKNRASAARENLRKLGRPTKSSSLNGALARAIL